LIPFARSQKPKRLRIKHPTSSRTQKEAEGSKMFHLLGGKSIEGIPRTRGRRPPTRSFLLWGEAPPTFPRGKWSLFFSHVIQLCRVDLSAHFFPPFTPCLETSGNIRSLFLAPSRIGKRLRPFLLSSQLKVFNLPPPHFFWLPGVGAPRLKCFGVNPLPTSSVEW